MFTRESLRKKGHSVMHDLNSSTCRHGLRRGDCNKCSAANSRYEQFMRGHKTVASKQGRPATNAVTGIVDMKVQQPCHTSPTCLVDTMSQPPSPNNVACRAKLQQRRPDSNAGLTCGGAADSTLQHLGGESFAGFSDATKNASFDGFPMHSVGEPCKQPGLLGSTLRAALLGVPTPCIPEFPRHPSASMQKYDSNEPSAHSSPALSAGRCLEETWEVETQQTGTLLKTDSIEQIMSHLVDQLCGDASNEEDLSKAAYMQEKCPLHRSTSVLAAQGFVPSPTTWRRTSHFMPEQPPPPVREPMYVYVPRLEAGSSDFYVPCALATRRL